jgi:phosphoadenosine phosphosulfate reductase
MNKTSPLSITTLNTFPEDIVACLSKLCEQHPGSVVFTSSLGEEDQAITYLIATHKLPIRIITLDTGRHFAEYYDLIDQTQRLLKISIEIVFPEREQVNSFIDEYGINGFYNSLEARKQCCQVRKVNPLNRALEGMAVWVTGLRADQSEGRADLSRFEQLPHILKYNPLIAWTNESLEAFISKHDIPINPLHKKGYKSIGCAPCTRPIDPDEHPRNGRWWWEQSKKECGLHN